MAKASHAKKRYTAAVDQDLIERRVKLLESFLEVVESMNKNAQRRRRQRSRANPFTESGEDALDDNAKTRATINRMVTAIKQAVEDVGEGTVVTVRPPPVIGGPIMQVSVFDNLFNPPFGQQSPFPVAVDIVNKALGAYEAMSQGLVRLERRDAIDLVSAINRALRPAFKDPPDNEKQVQDSLATIIRSLGLDAHREQERAAVGTTTFIPDFTVPSLDLAIEVKLANAKHGEADVQHELAEDVASFRTKWRHLLAVVYDVGVIRDPEKVKAEFEKHFGVQVLIIKH